MAPNRSTGGGVGVSEEPKGREDHQLDGPGGPQGRELLDAVLGWNLRFVRTAIDSLINPLTFVISSVLGVLVRSYSWTMKSREIRLTRHFTGPVLPEYFETAEVDLPDPGEGEIQVKNAWLSVDPYMRGRMIGIKTYVDPFRVGEAMEGGAVGQVVKSNARALLRAIG
jgi:hypothetical protein